MSDDHFDSDIADQLCHDLLLARLTDSDSTEVSDDVQKTVVLTGVLKTASSRLFLQSR